jgi:flagellar hook assembly protein FlgD
VSRTYPADIEVIADLTPAADSPTIVGVSPNPFSPDRGEVAWMELNAPATDRLTLRIYDLKGRLVRTCLNNAPGGHQNFPWDGKDNMGRRANIGIYIAHLRCVSPQGGNVDRTKLVVLGTPLE